MSSRLSAGIAVLVAATFLTQGCAATMRNAQPPDRPRTADPAVLADYVQRLPPGTSVKVERTSGRSLRGTLMKATADAIVVQPRTRLPEPPIEIPLAEVLTVTPESGNGGSIGKAIAAGVAAGAGAALVTFFVLLSIFSD
jgi:hypothetical protein